uniref:Uncharacterized protein n=1 Tax=Solanum tuberosum TaxID=4113 RepID=M1B0K6_SOLTU
MCFLKVCYLDFIVGMVASRFMFKQPIVANVALVCSISCHFGSRMWDMSPVINLSVVFTS